MSFSDCLSFAVSAALTLDIPDEGFTSMVYSQACLLAGMNPDDLSWPDAD